MLLSSRWFGGAMVLVAGLMMTACAPSAAPRAKPASATATRDHAGHDHAKHEHGEHAAHDTLAGAVAELEKISASVKEELGKKNLDEADGHVHMVGHLVDDMHRLVSSSKLTDEMKTAAKKALDEIFDCFDKLDTALHSSDEKVKEAIDYAEHEPRIQAALVELNKAAATIEEAVADLVDKAERPDGGAKTDDGVKPDGEVKQSVENGDADQ